MDKHTEALLKKAEVEFNGLVGNIHKAVEPKDGWKRDEEGRYVKVCMYCGSTVTVDPRADDPISVWESSRYGCVKPHEEDRIRRTGHK